MNEPSNRGRWIVLGLSALLAAALLAPLQMMPFGRLSALYAVCARTLESDLGAAHDVLTVAPPGTAAWYLAARVFIGPLEGDARLLEWIWMTLTCVMAALVVYEWTGRKAWAGVLAAVALALQHVSGGFSLTMLSGQLAMLPLMIGLGLWGSPAEPRRGPRAAGSVVAFVVSALFSLLAVIAVVVLAFVEVARLVKKRWSLGNAVPGLVTAFVSAEDRAKWFRHTVTALLAIVVLTLARPLSSVKQYRLFWRYLSGEVATSMAGRFTCEDNGGPFFYPEVREVAGWLARSAKPGWRLLVLGREPGLYHYSELPPAGAMRYLAGIGLGACSEGRGCPVTGSQPEMVVLTPFARDRRVEHQRVLKNLGYLSAGRYLGYRLYLRGDVAAAAFPPK